MFRSEARGWMGSLCLISLVLSIGAAASNAFGAEPEFRAIACSRFEWPNQDLAACKAYIDTLMQRLHDNNFNAVILQMRGQADTLYPSPYEPWSYILSSDGNAPTGWGDFDPMAYAINKAHENGLELHAYLNAHVCWNNASPPNYAPNHLFWRHCNVNDPAHRDWLVCDGAGAPVGYTSGNEYVWIAPGIPDFQAYWRKQIMYVVDYYDGSDPVKRPRVDGVHFDRIRTNSTDWSHDPISEARRLGDANPANLSFGDWTRDQITRTLCDLYAQINESHPYVKVSSAPLGMHSGSRYPGLGYPTSDCGYGGYGYSCKYQDPQGWLAAGAQDFICPQIYWADPPWRTSNPHFSGILPDWLNHNSGRHVYAFGNVSATGPGLLSENSVVRTMVAQIGQGNAPGNVYWYYGGFFGIVPPTYTVDLGPFFSSPGGPYEEPTSVPPMPWKESPTDGIIIGNVTNGVGPVVDVHVTRSGLDDYVALSSADGVYSFLLVPPGTYTLAFSKAGYDTRVISGVTVAAGQVKRVDAVMAGPDVPPPVVSNVTTSGITETRATVAWNVDRNMDTELAYGTAPGQYTAQIGITDDKVGLVALTNLSPGTKYYYRVTAFDGVNPPVSSEEQSFTTVAEKLIADLVLDNLSSAVVFDGAWLTGSGASDKYAADYRFANVGTGECTAVFTPTIAAGGPYELYAWWPKGTNRSSAAPFLITDSTGTHSITQNQKKNGGMWNLLGTYTFAAGTAGNVTITNNFPSSTGSVVMADAIKLVYVGPADVILADAGRDWSVPEVPFSVQIGGEPTARGGTPPLTYAWTLTSNPGGAGQIDQPSAANPTFMATAAGTYEISLLVTDAASRQAVDTVTIAIDPVTDLASSPSGVTRVAGPTLDGLFGNGNASVAFGDVNGDGYADTIVGTTTGNGTVTIIYGAPTASPPSLIDLAQSLPAGVSTTTIAGGGGQFGAAVAAGDIDGDGFDDAVIGVPQDTAGSSTPGEAFVVYGQADLATITEVVASAVTPSALVRATHLLGDQWSPRSAFGGAVALGDLNADGFKDVIVGAMKDGQSVRDGAGIVYVFYGSSGMPPTAPTTMNTINMSEAAGTFGESRVVGAAAGDQLGTAVAAADVDGDGYDDLLLGAQSAGPWGRVKAGAVYVVYGAGIAALSESDRATIDLRSLPAGVTKTEVQGAEAADLCGHAVAAGDTNGDGYSDLIVGAYSADAPGGTDAGKVFVVYGDNDLHDMASLDLLAVPAEARVVEIRGQYLSDRFGWAVSAGDINGDGLDDVLSGAYVGDPPFAPPRRTDAGMVNVQFGSTMLPMAPIDLNAGQSGAYVFGARAGDRLGSAIRGGADINFDGLPDYVVTAPKSAWSTGAAYAVYGFQSSSEATTVYHDRAGDAPPRDFGPTVRCTIDYADSGQAINDASRTSVTLFRSNAAANIGPLSQAANAIWQITTDRTGAWTAMITFRFLSSEVAGLNLADLQVFKADSLAGPFTEQPTTVDAVNNTITTVVGSMGVFAFRDAVQWTVSPTAETFLEMEENGTYPRTPVVYTITNAATRVNYAVSKDCDWVSLSKADAVLPPRGSTDMVVASLNARTRSLPAGVHTCTLTFRDGVVPGVLETARITVTVHASGWTVTEGGGLVASGRMGGAFSPNSFGFALSNTGEVPIDYTVTLSPGVNWLTLSKDAGGPIPPAGADTVSATINANANSLPPQAVPYVAEITFAASSGSPRIITKQISLLVTNALYNDPPQDVDGDGDVDLADFAMFSACFNGPNRAWVGSIVCGAFDADGDTDLDLQDFGAFRTCFNGPNRPPACE